MNKRELIKNSPIFADIGNDSIAKLEKIVQKANFNTDNILFSEGDAAEALYILDSGAVDLIKSSPDGKEKLIRSVGIGETFAEAAMFCGEDYPVTAIAKKRSSVLMIRKDDFIQFVRSNPKVSLRMMGAMAKLLRQLNTLVANISLGSVKSRLASYLIERAENAKSDTFELGIKKRDFAFQIGTISETLSRNLKSLKEDGIIDVRGTVIAIKDISRLRMLVYK